MENKVKNCKDTEAKLTGFTQVQGKLILCVFEYLHKPFYVSKKSYLKDELGINLRMVKHIGQNRREDTRREKLKGTTQT